MYLHPEGGRETAGSNAPGAFLVVIGGVSFVTNLPEFCERHFFLI